MGSLTAGQTEESYLTRAAAVAQEPTAFSIALTATEVPIVVATSSIHLPTDFWYSIERLRLLGTWCEYADWASGRSAPIAPQWLVGAALQTCWR